MKQIIKKFIYILLKLYESTIGKVLYFSAKKYASFHTKLMHYSDWYFSGSEPSSYKHEINLYNWIYDPSQVEFVEGGVFGRMLIEKEAVVLDLCCGDGSYDYLFFSDVAKHIDAIDYDKTSIDYAKKRYQKENIAFICHDLLTYEFEDNHYDVVIWRAGVAYFTKEQREVLFKNIFKTLKKGGKFYIGTPLMEKENFSANQVEVIVDEKLFEDEFSSTFNLLFQQKTFYENRVNINYILEKR